MSYLAKKVNQRFENAFGQNPFQGSEVPNNANNRVDKKSKNNPSSKKVVGEYIDFEEID